MARMQGRQLPSPSHAELSTEVQFHPTEQWGGAQQLLRAPHWIGQNCLVKEEPQHGPGVCSAPTHGPGERCPAGSAELSRAGAPRGPSVLHSPSSPAAKSQWGGLCPRQPLGEVAGDSQAPVLPCGRAQSRDNFTNPSASNFFLFSMICRESTKSSYPQGSWLPTAAAEGL